MDYGSFGGGDFTVSQSHSYSQASVRKEPLGTAATAPVQIEQPRRSSDSNVVINPSLAGSSEFAVAAPLSVAVYPEKVSSDNMSVSSSTKGSTHSSSRAVEASAATSSGWAESQLGSISRKLQQISEFFQRTVLNLLPVRMMNFFLSFLYRFVCFDVTFDIAYFVLRR